MAGTLPKLVRDKIPHIIDADGRRAVVHTANDEEYREKLDMKLLEEIAEFNQYRDAAELADVLEVVYALAAEQGMSKEELEAARAAKEKARGGFGGRIVLDRIEE